MQVINSHYTKYENTEELKRGVQGTTSVLLPKISTMNTGKNSAKHYSFKGTISLLSRALREIAVVIFGVILYK